MGRRFGQHFLARKSILNKIAASIPGEPQVIIEIGAGKGALTESLLEREGPKIFAIEVDTVLVHYLTQRFRPAIDEGRLSIIEGDVLKTDLAALDPCPAIVGNLPYYITSPILEKVFALGSSRWSSAVFLVQAEVADRITASPGTRAFGYLSVLAQVHSYTNQLFAVPREAFRPPPKVENTVIGLSPRNPSDFGISETGPFLRFAQTCFRHKRKTLRNNLLEAFPAEKLASLSGSLPELKMRAEQLGVADLADLYRKLSSA